MRKMQSLAMVVLWALGAGAAGCGALPEEEQAGAGEPAVSSISAAAVVVCPDPKSCGSWSSWYDIGTAACQSAVPDCAVEVCRACNCNIDTCDTCCTVRQRSGLIQTQESFRDCRLQNGSRCREKREQQVVASCGC